MHQPPERSPGDRYYAGPLPFSEQAYRRVCALAHRHFGIHFAQEKQALVVNRLHRHLQERGYASYEAFLDEVESDSTGGALDVLASLLSTNHTYFFREEAHFDFLRAGALPEIEARLERNGERDLRLWCAAASTGEEPYSIAMTMLDHFGSRYGRYDAGLLATDLSLQALRQAEAGLYGREQVERVPEGQRLRYFSPREGRFAVVPEVRQQVLFRKFNLTATHFPFKRPFHIIFCRNVMIYFDVAVRRRLVAMLYDFTAPGGYLLIGHAETIDSSSYRRVRTAVYQRPFGRMKDEG